MCPVTARPTRQVSPTTAPLRLRMAEMRCSVPSTPARLSPPKSPSAASACARSSLVICESVWEEGGRCERWEASSRRLTVLAACQPVRPDPAPRPPGPQTHLCLAQELAASLAQETGLGAAPKVQYNLEQAGALRVAGQRRADVGGQHLQQRVQVVAHNHAAILLRQHVVGCGAGWAGTIRRASDGSQGHRRQPAAAGGGGGRV